ncbi:zinc finger protein 862-like [Ruditapes philippinarum]|uniref:zinc finger protein 862-like n=1 Tax=Ruditapes philippinarum TaxID=129788 RepID=UPI00295A5CBB|nr:zinc finger protein 862-like [Ruditapes philippinarum]
MEGCRDVAAGSHLPPGLCALNVHPIVITRALDGYRLHGIPARRHAGGRQKITTPAQDRCLSTTYVAHRLALAVAQAVKGVPYLPRFKDILGDLHRFYDHSPVRTSGLKDIQKLLNEPVLKLVEAKDVRWLSHDKATSTLMKCIPSVFTSLEREAEERNDVRAAGLAKFTQDHRFVMSLHRCATLYLISQNYQLPCRPGMLFTLL